MHRSWLAITLWIFACDGQPAAAGSQDAKPAAKAEAPAEARPEAKAPAEPEAKADPVLLAVCAAFDEEIAANPSDDRILSRVALRAVTKHGISEAQISTIGPLPADLLAMIRAQGSPPACKAFEERLASLPSP